MTGSSADDQLLSSRAATLARPLDDEADVDTFDLLVLALGDQQVAVRLQDVRAVRPPGPVTLVPQTGAAFAGVVGGYGDVLPVAGLGTLLGLAPGLPPDQQWVIVLDDPAAPLGLLADVALDIVTIRAVDLSTPADSAALVTAVLPDGTVVLDGPAVLSDPRVSFRPPYPTEEPSWRDR